MRQIDYHNIYYIKNRERLIARNKERREALSPEARRAHRQAEYAKMIARRPLSNVWAGIKARTLSPASTAYKFYGALGVTMEPSWIADYEKFERDITARLGPRPEGHTLDRIDPNGHYVLPNLRWADSKTQAANKRGTWAIRANAKLNARIEAIEAQIDALLLEYKAA